MNRRHALKILTGAAFATCSTCLSITAALAAEKLDAATGKKAHNKAVKWGYEGIKGPEYWGDLSPAYRVCSVGFQQSPVDINGAIRAEMKGVDVSYGAVPLRVINNGHTIEVVCEPGGGITMDGKYFELVQYHFHHPSEHTLRGNRFDMEAHFVHVSKDGALAVLGAFITQGAVNEALAPIWQYMPTSAGPEKLIDSVNVYPERLLPGNRTFYRYYGSLTTPPCSEKVTWIVYKTPVEASAGQVQKFASIFPRNARPIQNLNRRFLLQSK